MNTSNLSLSLVNTPSTIDATSPLEIEEKIAQPLMEVLTDITPQGITKSNLSLVKSLNDLFPEQEYEEKQVKRAKEILGNVGDQLSESQIRDITCEVKFLVTTWLDDFERNIFEGLTLQEMLHEKGGT